MKVYGTKVYLVLEDEELLLGKARVHSITESIKIINELENVRDRESKTYEQMILDALDSRSDLTKSPIKNYKFIDEWDKGNPFKDISSP